MLFETTLTIPAGTAASAPAVETLRIANGIITKFMVRPRPGHAGTAHCIILYHEHQIAPSTAGMTLHGDTFPIDWEDYYEVYQPPYELKIRGWAPTSTYDHAFDIAIAVLPRKALAGPSVADSLANIFSALSPRRIFTGGGG